MPEPQPATDRRPPTNRQAQAHRLAALQPPPSLAAVNRILDGYKRFQALLAGYDSGLFEWLARQGPAGKSRIAAHLKLRTVHLDAYLQTLVDMGLVRRRAGAYALAHGMADVLDATQPWCQEHAAHELLSPASGWSALQDFLTEGWRPGAWPAQASPAQHPLRDEAQALATALTHTWRTLRGQDEARSLLCYDGGGGIMAGTLCQHLGGTHATVVVAPHSRQRTENTLVDCGVYPRCRLVTAEALDAGMAPANADLVVMFHCLYPVRRGLAAALRSAARHLAPGGHLWSAHWHGRTDDGATPRGLRDLDQAVLTDSHPLRRSPSFCQELNKAGLVDARHANAQDGGGRAQLYFARRPDPGRGD